jgi:hypothetical protein
MLVKENFIQQEQFIFASAMKQDYLVYPSMIGSQSRIMWSYDNSDVVSTFDGANPLNVSSNHCNNVSICLWYISPLQSLNDSSGTQYALLGEWNKWTAVSQQRFTSIITDTKKNQATVTVQGVSGETVLVVVFHSVLLSVTVNCSISTTTSQAHLVITPSNVVCS